MQPNHYSKLWVHLISSFFLILFSNAALSDTLTLKGKLGKYPILMELSIMPSGEVEGRYAYDGKLVAIPLAGKDLASLIENRLPPRIDDWEEARDYIPEPMAIFNGTLSNNRYLGTWSVIGRHNRLKFDLTEVSDNRTDEEIESSYHDLFDHLISQQITFEPTGNTHHADGRILVLEDYEEPITGIVGVRLANLGNKLAQEKINQALQESHQDEVERSLWCLSEGYVNAENSVGHVLEPSYIKLLYYSNSLLEIVNSGSVYCGGAHPSNYYNLSLFDADTGESVDLTALFTVYSEDEKGRQSLSAEFETVLLKYLDQGHHCIIDEVVGELSNNTIALHMTQENTVAVKFESMGHAAFVCELDDIAVIPIDALRDLALPGAVKYFPMLK